MCNKECFISTYDDLKKISKVVVSKKENYQHSYSSFLGFGNSTAVEMMSLSYYLPTIISAIGMMLPFLKGWHFWWSVGVGNCTVLQLEDCNGLFF